jgi:hypothetical protein
MQVLVRTSFRRVARLVRNDREFLRATRRMPRPVPWDWAAPRLMPLLAGPRNDAPGEELVRGTSATGCAIEFGIDLGGHFPLVDRSVAERWETSLAQLAATAAANLERSAAAIPPAVVRTAVRSGRIVRFLDRPAGCASSLLLSPAQLRRLFGEHDQVFGAPGRHTLVSFPIEMPTETIAELHVEMESDELFPLFLQPFQLVDGQLIWADTEPPDGDDG